MEAHPTHKGTALYLLTWCQYQPQKFQQFIQEMQMILSQSLSIL